jgi:hypothetical protein
MDAPVLALTHQPSYLTLGWKTTWKPGDAIAIPSYWTTPNAKQGEQSGRDLLLLDASSVAQHTAVIAQSGSGKSFFMGRFVEEILLQTKARCLIFDPNADFRRIDEIENESLWDKNQSLKNRRGRFTHERARSIFAKPWRNVPINILTGKDGPHGRSKQPLQLWWPTIPAQILAQELPPHQHNDLLYCHEAVDILGFLIEHKSIDFDGFSDLVEESHKIFRLARAKSKRSVRLYIKKHYDVMNISKSYIANKDDVIKFARGDEYFVTPSQIDLANHELIERMRGLRDYVSQNVERYYFGKARLYQSVSLIETPSGRLLRALGHQSRLEVIDLPSMHENVRIDIIGSILNSAWEDARLSWEAAMRSANSDDRVPRFIIIDEAHNLIPAEPKNKGLEALRDEFRRIVAEGRKYGLFLILVSQRPDKLDPLIVSECENKVVMKISSMTVLRQTKQMLGLDDIDDEIFSKCLFFKTGVALIYGKWTNYCPEIIYSASRRTLEGGRDLNPKHWAFPV